MGRGVGARARLVVAAVAAFCLVAFAQPQLAAATYNCYDYGTQWTRSPWGFMDATPAGQIAATRQLECGSNYTAWSAAGGGYADEMYRITMTAGTLAVYDMTHGGAGETILIDRPSRSNVISCFRITNIGAHGHTLSGHYQSCGHQRTPSMFTGSVGAKLVVFQGCETAKASDGFTNGLAEDTYYDLYPAQCVVGFTQPLSGQADGNGVDVIAKKWSNVFWDTMSMSPRHSAAYSTNAARDAVLSTYGTYAGYNSRVCVGDSSYCLP